VPKTPRQRRRISPALLRRHPSLRRPRSNFLSIFEGRFEAHPAANLPSLVFCLPSAYPFSQGILVRTGVDYTVFQYAAGMNDGAVFSQNDL
jgi:hypothetical protein